MSKYIVVAESYTSRLCPAKLCRAEGYRDRYVETARGTVEQMQDLADELNAKEKP